jgi:23S rRNA pseudouridine1911/1915/1917 synthase
LKEKIFYESPNFLGVRKPVGLPTTYKNKADSGDCLVDRIRNRFPDSEKVDGFKPRERGLLYRLDNDTSGVVVFARTQTAFDTFKQLQDKNQIGKWYYAVALKKGGNSSLVKRTGFSLPSYAENSDIPVLADFPINFFRYFNQITLRESFEDKSYAEDAAYSVIDCEIGHSAKSSKRMLAVEGANYKTRGTPRSAKTLYRILAENAKLALIEAFITKGMRHQIRVHMAAAGFPILGDDLYGEEFNGDYKLGRRMYLHCGHVSPMNAAVVT